MSVPQSVTDRCVRSLLGTLIAALAERGLVAETSGPGTVLVKNTAAEPPGGDPRAAILSPGLRQPVTCRPDDAGRLAWFWVWTGPTRQSPPELEYLCPAEAIDHVADRVAHVLRLDDVDPEALR